MSRQSPSLIGRVWRVLNTEIGPKPKRPRSRRERGAALIFVLFSITLLAAVMMDHSYKSQIDLASSNNVRDELKAEYLARSAINITRIMLKVQSRVIDSNRRLIAQFLGKDLQIGDIMPMFLKIFFGNADLLEGFGMDSSEVRGLDLPKNYGVPKIVEIGEEDGKLNLNCAFTRQASDTNAALLYAELLTLFADPRYEPLFESLDEIEDPARTSYLARAIMDYIDPDKTQFGSLGAAGEDYRYDRGEDPYEPKNNFLDSVQEAHLIKGINDNVWSVFGPSMTIYGTCIPNLCAVPKGNWLLAAAVIVQSAADGNSPVLFTPGLLPQVARAALMLLHMTGCTDLGVFAQGAANPAALVPLMPIFQSNPMLAAQMMQMPGIELDPQRLSQSAYVGPRRFYKVVVAGHAGFQGKKKGGESSWKVTKTITAVWDQAGFSTSTGQRGNFIYWRQE